MRTGLRSNLGVSFMAFAFLVLVSACGGSGSKGATGSPTGAQTRLGTSTPGSEPSEVTVHCDKFSGVAQEIIDAETKIYSGKATESDLADLATRLKAVKGGAPAGVRAAVDELLYGFDLAKKAVAAPTGPAVAKLRSMASRLSADGQTITTYVVNNCKS